MNAPRHVIASHADVAASVAARDVCRRHATSFYHASVFLPREKRDAGCAVVAFLHMVREAMDAADESLEGAHGLRHYPIGAVRVAGLPAASACTSCGPSGSLDSRLALLAERLEDIYTGKLELPNPETRSPQQHAISAFARAVARFDVPRQHFLDFAEGCRADRLVSRYATWASLQRHCRQTAGAAALALAAVLGVTHSGAGEHAVQLATAMRLTSILRDLKPDGSRGKLYLPLEDLARFRYSERDLAGTVVNDCFRDLMRFEIARARQLFEEGSEGLCWLGDDRSRLTVATLAASSAGVLDAIERRGYDVFTTRPAPTLAQTLRRIPAVWKLSRRRPGDALPPVFHAAR